MSQRQFWTLTMAIALGLVVHDSMEAIAKLIHFWMGFR